jgi:hypothetical protein
MTQFLPGVSAGSTTLGDFNFAFNSGDSFNINGARTQDTLYTIDGAPAVVPVTTEKSLPAPMSSAAYTPFSTC